MHRLAGVDATVQGRHLPEVHRFFGGVGAHDFRKGTAVDAVHHHAPTTANLPNVVNPRHGQAHRLGLRQSRRFPERGVLGHARLVELYAGLAQFEDLGILA